MEDTSIGACNLPSDVGHQVALALLMSRIAAKLPMNLAFFNYALLLSAR
jgi:hypothetical protein